MSVRYICTIEGFEDAWVDISEAWTRQEIQELAQSTEITVVMDYWNRKIVACHLPLVDGTYIDDIELLTQEVLTDSVDVRFADFMGYVLVQACGWVRTLGPLSGRPSSDSVAKAKTQTTTKE